MDSHLEWWEMKKIKMESCIKLLKAKEYIQKMKKEELDPSILKMIHYAYNCMLELKFLNERISKMDVVDKDTPPQELDMRIALEDLRISAREQIDTIINYLESKTNLLTTRTGVLSALEDLEIATSIFKERNTISANRK